ncbi:NUDIX hydrolase [Paenibacillus sp. J2TS4]|uniref:NUDIX hydrolase n=1 Tax=Paenibacillus sp. J2TS4 TaxID=2807194 RepID=UPI001B2BCE40|nr:NUDIX hydrolase [Paenibacillus sp. J2TS4]GIP32130.1 DNA mismatch repair protein MutT [Paenibacillus sp. J2TS4]
MDSWSGSAGVCVNDLGQLLMVLQGKPEEKKVWSVPSGGQEGDETLEECCVREVYEETGYEVKVVKEIQKKQGKHNQIEFTVTYFAVERIGGTAKIQDPDGLIYDIAWKSAKELQELELSFPEDRAFLLEYLKSLS